MFINVIWDFERKIIKLFRLGDKAGIAIIFYKIKDLKNKENL